MKTTVIDEEFLANTNRMLLSCIRKRILLKLKKKYGEPEDARNKFNTQGSEPHEVARKKFNTQYYGEAMVALH